MRKLGILALTLPVVAGCGTELAPTAERPSPVAPTTPQYRGPTRFPSRSPLPESAYRQVTATRLSAPRTELHPAAAGNAQVIFACDYEEWSPQFSNNVGNSPNPPGRHLRGDDRGDVLTASTAVRAGRALGSHADDDDYVARSYTEDSWPDRKVITAFEVQRASLTKRNVADARNEYAKGCSTQYTEPLLGAVEVSIYAPWDWKL